ncbi:MAG: energy transducer TonB [Deferribacteraceae bacterium]|nr:energy transducer TonB [Deferribacteraceae bacterium]
MSKPALPQTAPAPQISEPVPPKPAVAPIKSPSPAQVAPTRPAPAETRVKAPPETPPLPEESALQPESHVRSVITPQIPDPDRPPAPMSVDEFLAGQEELKERMGPDRDIPDITRDYLRNQEKVPGEDSVSFNKMSFKYEAYFYAFARSLYRQWKYPADAARRGEAGIVRINFSITREGRITNVILLESSGYPALDREAIRALRSMDAVPLPEWSELNMMHVNGYFIYSLNGMYRLF